MAEKKLSKKALNKSFRNWAYGNLTCFSQEHMQTFGYLCAMLPLVEELYDTKEEQKEAMNTYTAFFNTEPQVGSIIVGITAGLEEAKANGNEDIDAEAINGIRAGLMGPLAGIGDTITQGLVKTVALAIGVDMTLKGSALGPIIFCLLYGIYLMAMGIFTFSKGYTLGRSILSKITDKRIMNKITDILSIIGLTIAGAMIANNVNITTPLQFTISDSTIVIQDLLNSILPGLLSVVAVVGVFMSLRKNTSVFKIMIIMFVIAVVCSLIGIL